MFSAIMLTSKLRKICRNKKLKAGQKTWKIEQALRKSKLPVLRGLLRDDPDCVEQALDILLGTDTCTFCGNSCDAEFEATLRISLEQIRGYSQLMAKVEGMRRIPYSSDNIQHEDMLLQLWERLCPQKPLRARVTKQWTEIGFQGRNPVTDFRGMGLLGLQNLLFFATLYPDAAQELLQHSRHPDHGYSFAIVGINMTSLAYNLLFQGHLKPYMYNVTYGAPQLQDFDNFYCYLFSEFDHLWLSAKPKDLMQFTAIKSKFEKSMFHILRIKNVMPVNPFIKDSCHNSKSQLLESVSDKRTSITLQDTESYKKSYYMWV